MTLSVESYSHRAAKAVVAGWLRRYSRAADAAGWCRFGWLWWRATHGHPSDSVYLEYAIGHRCADGTRYGLRQLWAPPGPTYEALTAAGHPPEFIVDVAVEHNSRAIQAGIEIVHKHEPSGRKLDVLCEELPHVLVLPAQWVLGQVACPPEIPERFRVGGSP